MVHFSRYTTHLLAAAFIGSSLQGCLPINADTRYISLGEQWKPFDGISTSGFSVQSPVVWQSRRLEFGVIGAEKFSGNQRFEFLRTWLGVRFEPVDWRRIAEASPPANSPNDPSAALFVQSAENWIPYRFPPLGASVLQQSRQSVAYSYQSQDRGRVFRFRPCSNNKTGCDTCIGIKLWKRKKPTCLGFFDRSYGQRLQEQNHSCTRRGIGR